MTSISEYIIVLSYMIFLGFSPGPNSILCSVSSTKYGIRKTLTLLGGVIPGFFLVGFSTTSSWMFIGSLLRKFLSDSRKAKTTNYILGTLLAIVAIDLVFHDEILGVL